MENTEHVVFMNYDIVFMTVSVGIYDQFLIASIIILWSPWGRKDAYGKNNRGSYIEYFLDANCG